MADMQLQDRQQWMGVLARADEAALAQLVQSLGELHEHDLLRGPESGLVMVRGRYHNGNISARDLADAPTLDIPSSDYIPASLFYAALIMDKTIDRITLPQAIAAITRTPARQIGLEDRGEISVGKRGDRVRCRETEKVPVIRSVWREGQLVA